jgi:hypothetical protein
MAIKTHRLLRSKVVRHVVLRTLGSLMQGESGLPVHGVWKLGLVRKLGS